MDEIWHPDMPDEYKNAIITGDARELAKRIPDESIDLIFTDPPYPKEYLYLYEWLANEAPRLMKPTGFFLVYVAPFHKDTVMNYFYNNKNLEYYWDYVEYFSGNSTIIWPRNTISRYKSIVAYRIKGSGSKCRHNALGVLPGDGKLHGDKRFHKWVQSIRTAQYYIDYFSKKGELVVDFFVGAGTTVAACKIKNRNYIAFEIDPKTAEIARERIRNTQPPLFVLEPEQIEFFDES